MPTEHGLGVMIMTLLATLTGWVGGQWIGDGLYHNNDRKKVNRIPRPRTIWLKMWSCHYIGDDLHNDNDSDTWMFLDIVQEQAKPKIITLIVRIDCIFLEPVKLYIIYH